MPKKRILFILAFSPGHHANAINQLHIAFGNTNRLSFLCLKDTTDFQRFVKEFDLKPDKGNVVILHYNAEHKIGGGELNGFFCVPVFFDELKQGWLCNDGDCWTNTLDAIRDKFTST